MLQHLHTIKLSPPALEICKWAFENSADCVKLLDLDGRLLAVNEQSRQLMQIDDFSRICQSPWSSLWPLESRALVEAALAQARQGQTGHFKAYRPTLKGMLKWWDVRVTSLRDARGVVEKLLCVSRDVTEMHHSKEALRNAASRLQFTLQAAAIGEWDLDLRTGQAQCSLRHFQCFGYDTPLPDWGLDALLKHVHPEDRPRVRQGLEEALCGQANYGLDCRVVWPDATVHWIEAHGTVYRDPDGEPLRLVGIVSDITDRKRTEMLARARNKAFKLAVTQAALPSILDVLARSMEEQSGGRMLASVLLLDADGKRLRHGASPSLPLSYSQGIDGVEIGPAAGSCGTAIYRGKPVFVRDIASDPLWRDFKDTALAHGLRSCCSHPILSADGKALGTLAAYYREVCDPSEKDLESLALLVDTAGLIIERYREAEERKAAETALRASEARLSSLVNATSAILWTCSATGEIVEDQAGWRAFTGQSFEEMRGLGWLSALHADDQAAILAAWTPPLQPPQAQKAEYRLRRADGEYRCMSVRAVPMRDAEGRVTEWVGANIDITERKEAERHLHRLANHDMLTGLPNRAYLHQSLQSLLGSASPGDCNALLMIDLDRFKQVNDSLGHEAGDVLLQQVAQRFKSVLRSGDLVSRLGGDEFVVVARHVPGRRAAQAIGEKLIASLKAPIQIGRHQVIMGASIGGALHPEHGHTKEALFQQADLAMYRAKEAGRNCFRFYAEEMGVQARQRMGIEMALHRALEHGQFEVHYQPRLDLRTMQPVGLEALVRWHHPERGWIPPLEFIPIAEETGLINSLGAWVLQQACADAAFLCQLLRLPLRVSVNLSARQLKSPQLVDEVRQALASSNLSASQLELELTESALIDDMETSAQTLHALKALGIHLSVDDFGTGYSSLAYLQRFPIDTVKLDRSFILQSATGASRHLFVKAASDMVHALQMKVVAEGVEDQATLELLQSIDCDEAQGYLFARPAPLLEIASSLKSLLQLPVAAKASGL